MLNSFNGIENLIKYEGNGKIIFLNPLNHHWVRMKKERFEIAMKHEDRKRRLFEQFDREYDLFGNSSDDCNIRSVYFSVTGKCNMQCAFCTMNSGPNVSTEKDFTFFEIKNQLIPKLQLIKPRKIIITGGEPLVRDDIVEILSCFSESFGKQSIILQTNGLLLSPEIVKAISPYIRSIEVSIENIFANDLLRRRMENIFKCIREQQIELSLSFVLDDESRPYLFEAIDLCHKYGGGFTLRVVSMVGRATESDYTTEFTNAMETLKVHYDFFAYLKEKKYTEDNFISSYIDNLQPKKACGAYGKILAIHPDGCTYMCGNFKKDNFSMGNIRTLESDEICKHLKNKLEDPTMMNKFLVSNNKMCAKCPEIYFCPGPCRAEVEECNEDSAYISSKCLSKKAMLRFAMYYYDKEKSVEENLVLLLNYLKDILDGKIILQ